MLGTTVVACCACVNIGVAVWAMVTQPALNSDFRGPWSFAMFARQHAAQLYQAVSLQAFQQQIYPGFRSFFPYLYPPSFLLPCWWLGDFGFAKAEMLWTLAGIAALGLAAAMLFRPGLRCFAIATLLASPASLLNGASGETGYFSTALLLAGFALLPGWPVAAGIAFGLLTLKPQLALLIPFALLARGETRALLAAGGTALGLIGLSCALFPPVLWLDWIHSLPEYQAAYLAAGKKLDLHSAVTVTGNLIGLGASPGLAWSLQSLASMGSAAAVFWIFRHGPTQLAVAAVCAGMFLCAPHAYAYDTLPIAAALLLLEPVSAAGAAGCALVYLAPYLLLTGAKSWFVYSIPETLLLVSIIYLAIRAMPRPNAAYEPVSAAEPR